MYPQREKCALSVSKFNKVSALVINMQSTIMCWIYRIAGNFRMVQNFAVFADRSASAKIRTVNFSSASYGLLVGVVSPEC